MFVCLLNLDGVIHLKRSLVSNWLMVCRSGKLKQGVLHVDRTSNLEAFVVTDGEQSGESKHRGSGTDLRDVLVTGRMNMNRAMDMDRVVVEMLPEVCACVRARLPYLLQWSVLVRAHACSTVFTRCFKKHDRGQIDYKSSCGTFAPCRGAHVKEDL